MKVTDKYVFFWDGIFSNFYPCEIIWEDKAFHSSEQLFMWFKATYFGDMETAEEILTCTTPKEAKKLGRKVKGFDEEKWNEYRERFMFISISEKFKKGDLLKGLMKYYKEGKKFVEASPYDRVWGIGMEEGNPNLTDESKWGENLLGKALDKLAERLAENQSSN